MECFSLTVRDFAIIKKVLQQIKYQVVVSSGLKSLSPRTHRKFSLHFLLDNLYSDEANFRTLTKVDECSITLDR